MNQSINLSTSQRKENQAKQSISQSQPSSTSHDTISGRALQFTIEQLARIASDSV
jgi:hypothetical protein